MTSFQIGNDWDSFPVDLHLHIISQFEVSQPIGTAYITRLEDSKGILEPPLRESHLQQPISSHVGQTQSRIAEVDAPTEAEPAGAAADSKSPGVYIRFYSTKMCRIGRLLNTPGPLKTSAIKLTLTAQSEVDIGRRSRFRRSSASTSWNRIPDSNSAPATE
ncbi:unnamed protein product [Rodentolepis nana]|uniref:Velvet domain-containing protein n=1 Tax=Rodentolepis nana TaxID=102285 RepID=A0A0R3TY04_RODNA|nr:unnamed protein product [Rodentolepis nana]